MDSKRLPLSSTVKPILLQADKEVIAVPAGETHYHIVHTHGTRTHVFNLEHPRSILHITGHVQTDELSELTATVVHLASDTKAETVVRTLGTGKSKSSFKGLIKIAPGAQHCESYLNHHSLLFEEARSYTWPALEIGNNEVKCSHAATVRTITDADLFYPRSRGIPKKDAEALMIEAFFSDVRY